MDIKVLYLGSLAPEELHKTIAEAIDAEDPTVPLRRAILDAINSDPRTPEEFAERGIPYWDTATLSRDFEVIGFMAPYVVVKRRSDGKMGSLMFQHHPRVYWGFEEDTRNAG